MAKIKQIRSQGTLLIQVLPSLDHPEEPAIKLAPGIPLRIHGDNGAYLYSLVTDGNQQVTIFQERRFYDGREGRLAEERYDWRPANQKAHADLAKLYAENSRNKEIPQ